MTDFAAMEGALRLAAIKYPSCRIANCDCNSKASEWKRGCWCMCHFYAMDEKYGHDQWNLTDFKREVERKRREPRASRGEA